MTPGFGERFTVDTLSENFDEFRLCISQWGSLAARSLRTPSDVKNLQKYLFARRAHTFRKYVRSKTNGMLSRAISTWHAWQRLVDCVDNPNNCCTNDFGICGESGTARIKGTFKSGPHSWCICSRMNLLKLCIKAEYDIPEDDDRSGSNRPNAFAWRR